ncbi:MAG TPA: hypothetical protein VF313_02125 [Anaerolineaceae bacterium]
MSRRRLLQKLEDGLQHGQRLTLVSAPPGFGKTTLITAWQKEQSGDQKKTPRAPLPAAHFGRMPATTPK